MSLTKADDMAETEQVLDDTLLKRKLINDFDSVSLYHMKVYLRVRPLTSKDIHAQRCLFVEGSQSVVLSAPVQSAVFRNHSSNEEKIKQRFTFTRVFRPADDQKTFFKGAVMGTVSEFVNGQNCLVFAYGATNSGKTYTVQGSATAPGVIPNAVDIIFSSIGSRLDSELNLLPINSSSVQKLSAKGIEDICASKESLLEGIEEFCTNMSSQCSDQSGSLFELSSASAENSKLSIHESENYRFQLWISFAEIYNENIFDLLDCSCPEKRRKLRLTLDNTGSSYVKDLKILPVNSPREARQFLSLGRKNLRIASTKLNQSSSRSHCIFTIYLVKVVDSPDPQQAMINSLSFCDLAGSERVVKTQNTGDRLKEAGKINNSLMVFGRCIEALRVAQNSKERPVVPYRDSKLTQLFQFFFSGKGRASMIVNVSPSVDMFDDTVNVLKVSAIAKQVVSDQLERTFLNLTSGSQRLTDLWIKSGERWSSFTRGKIIPGKMSIMTQREDSVLTEEDENQEQEMTVEEQPDIQELIDLVLELEKKCNSLMDENEELEIKLRKELYEEFQTQIENMQESYKKQVEKVKENAEQYWEKRLEIAHRALTINTRIQADDSQEDSDEENMEKDENWAPGQNELTLIKAENDVFANQIKTLQENLTEAETKAKHFEDRVLKLLKENEIQNTDLENLRSKLTSEAEEKIIGVTRLIEEKDHKIKELELRLVSGKEEQNQKNAEIQELESRLVLANEELNQKNAEIQKLLLKESDTNNEGTGELQTELTATQHALTIERNQHKTFVTELRSKHDSKVKLLEDEISSLSSKISQVEQFLQEERDLFEGKMHEDKELQAEKAKKIKALEEEVKNLIAKVSETSVVDARSDELQKKLQVLEDKLSQAEKNLKTAVEKYMKAQQDIEKMGDILFEKDTEISDLTTKVETLSKGSLERQKLRLSMERGRQEAEDNNQKMRKLLEAKDAEITLLKAQIATAERINTSEDFQVPTSRSTRGRRRRRPGNENKAPSDESSMDVSCGGKSSSSSGSPKENNKQTAFGIIDYIKQSPPVLAARNAIGNFRESMRLKSSSDDEPGASRTARKLRRKMYQKDDFEPLECTPPKQSSTTENVHTIVTRQLRSRSKI